MSPIVIPCPTCGGVGVINDSDGRQTECPKCHGSGNVLPSEIDRA